MVQDLPIIFSKVMTNVTFYNLPTVFTPEQNYLAQNYYLEKIPQKLGFYLIYYSYGAFTNNKNRLDFLNHRYDHEEVKISFCSENIAAIASMHRNHDLFNEYMHLMIGQESKHRIPMRNYFRLPSWCLALFGLTPTVAQIQATIDLLQAKRQEVLQRSRLYTLIADKDKALYMQGVKEMMLEMIADDDELGNIYVHCPGRLHHNTDELATKYQGDVLAYLEQFIFYLCPEEVALLGAVSPNLAKAFMSGCIPVYWGDLSEDNRYLNEQAMLEFDPTRRGELTPKLKEILLNLEEFVTRPLFHDGAAQAIYNEIYVLLLAAIENLLPGVDLYAMQKHPVSQQFFAHSVTANWQPSKVQQKFSQQLHQLLEQRGALLVRDNSPLAVTDPTAEQQAAHLQEFVQATE